MILKVHKKRRHKLTIYWWSLLELNVQELSRLFCSYGENTALECIALKAAMLCWTLLLQKPHPTASSKDFINCLQHRLSLWKQGNIDDLLLEDHTVQQCLSSIVSNVDHNECLTHSFVSHVPNHDCTSYIHVIMLCNYHSRHAKNLFKLIANRSALYRQE